MTASRTEATYAASLRATADTEPYTFYDAMRERGPVTWDDSMNAWLVTSYAACKDLERNEEILYRHAYLDMDSDVFIEVEGGPRNLLFLPGDDHAGIHRLLLRMLNPNVSEQHR